MRIQCIKRFKYRTSGAKKNAPSSFTLSISLGLEKCVPPLSRFLADWRASSALVKRRLRFPTFRARHTTSRNSCENRGVAGVDVFLLSCVFFFWGSGVCGDLHVLAHFSWLCSKFFFGKGTKVQLGFTSRFS